MRHATILLTLGALSLATFATGHTHAQDQPAEAAPAKDEPVTAAPAKAPKRPPGVWEEVPPEEPPEEETAEQAAEPRDGDELFQQEQQPEQQQQAQPPPSRPPPGYYPPGPPPSGPPPGWYPPGSPYAGIYAVPRKPPTKRNSTGMMVGGIVLAGFGGVALVVGAALANSGENGEYRCTGELCRNIPDEDKRNVGIGIALGGLGLIGAGIPLIVVGARQVPIATPTDSDAPPTAAWLAPELELGPTGGRLTWSF